MSKNISIKVGGVDRTFTGSKLRTALVGGGYCNWVPEDEGGGAQLNPATISISDNILTILDGDNGTFSQNFEIYSNGVIQTTVAKSTTTIDLRTVVDTSCTITVCVSGTGMITSVPSNSISYTPSVTVYNITLNLTNATAGPGSATTINEGGTALVNLIANTGYKFTDQLSSGSVVGATVSDYTATETESIAACVIELSNPTQNVTVTVEAIERTYTSNFVTSDGKVIITSDNNVFNANGVALEPPSVALSSDIITLTDNDVNSTGFKVYIDGTYKETISK